MFWFFNGQAIQLGHPIIRPEIEHLVIIKVLIFGNN
jgi:hypothetical protein